MANDWQTDPSGFLSSAIGAPVTITSGYRNPQQNAAVGGVPNSAHLNAQAFDFVPKGMNMADATSALVKSGVPFDQIYNEGDHVHVSFAPTMRRQVIPPKGQMDQSQTTQGPSDADLIAALTGKTAPQTAAPAATLAAGPAFTTPHAGWRSNGTNVEWYDPTGQTTAPQAPGQPPQQAGPSDQELIQALTAGAARAKATAPTSAQPSFLQSASAGVTQGARNVVSSLDPIAQYLDKHVGSLTLGGLLPTADQAHSNNLAARGQFNSQYGDNNVAQVGQGVGEIAASLPAFAAGGEVLAPLAEGISAAAPAVAPAVNFLTGASKGNKLLQVASKATKGALQGAGAAAVTSGGSDQPIGQQMQEGAETGGVLSSILPATKLVGNSLFNAVHSDSVPAARAALAAKAVHQYGIPLRGGQISQSPFMNYMDSAVSKLPFTGMEAQNEAQRTAFSKAVAGTFGEDADNLTPQVMQRAKTRIGSVYDDVATRTHIQNADQVMKQIGDAVSDAQGYAGSQDIAPILKQVENIGSTVDPATNSISGQSFKSLTAKGGKLDQAITSGSPAVRTAAKQIKTVLNNALQASAAPEDVTALKTADRQYKNLKTVENIAKNAGIEGEITPSSLLGAVKKSYSNMAYTGAGQIGDLANIGSEFLKEKPSSGTAERLLLYRLLEGVGSGAGGVFAYNHPMEAATGLGGAAGLWTAGRLAAAGLKSKAYRNMLLESVGHGQSTLHAAFGSPNAARPLGSNMSSYLLPSAVTGVNQLMLNRSPVSPPP